VKEWFSGGIDLSRASLPGVILLLAGAAACLFSGRSKKAPNAVRLIGLFIAALGALIATRGIG
jgi:hypothetical protein